MLSTVSPYGPKQYAERLAELMFETHDGGSSSLQLRFIPAGLVSNPRSARSVVS